MSRLARSCLLLPLLCGDTAQAADTHGEALTWTAPRTVRPTAEGFVIAAVPPPRIRASRLAPVALGRGMHLDRALFDPRCHDDKGASNASAC